MFWLRYMKHYLRNRFLFAQYITGWRLVVKWIYHESGTPVIYSLTTDDNKSLVSKNLFRF